MWSSKSYAQIWLPLAIIIKPEGKQRHTHTHTHSLRPVQSNQNYYTLDDWLFSIWHSVVFYISEVLLCRTDIWLMINESACTNVYGCARRTPVPFRVGSMWANDSILNTIILYYTNNMSRRLSHCVFGVHVNMLPLLFSLSRCRRWAKAYPHCPIQFQWRCNKIKW